MIRAITTMQQSLMMIVLAVIIGMPITFGQTSFKLDRQDGHYYMTTCVNGVPDTKIFVESGVNALFISDKDFAKLLAPLNLEKIDITPDYKIISDRASYKVLEAYKGKVPIGDLYYDGLVLVAESYNHIAVPVHLLKNAADSTVNLLQFNFKKGSLDFVRRDDVDLEKLNSEVILTF